LVPIRSKDIIKEYCDENDVDRAFIEDVMSFFWKSVRIKLTGLEYHRMYVIGLGTFEVKPHKISEHLKDFGNYVRKMDKIKYISSEKKESMKQYYESLLRLQSQLDNDKLKRSKILEKRYGKDYIGNLEK